MVRKVFAVTALSMTALTSVTGCSSSHSDSGKTVTISGHLFGGESIGEYTKTMSPTTVNIVPDGKNPKDAIKCLVSPTQYQALLKEKHIVNFACKKQ